MEEKGRLLTFPVWADCGFRKAKGFVFGFPTTKWRKLDSTVICEWGSFESRDPLFKSEEYIMKELFVKILRILCV